MFPLLSNQAPSFFEGTAGSRVAVDSFPFFFFLYILHVYAANAIVICSTFRFIGLFVSHPPLGFPASLFPLTGRSQPEELVL